MEQDFKVSISGFLGIHADVSEFPFQPLRIGVNYQSADAIISHSNTLAVSYKQVCCVNDIHTFVFKTFVSFKVHFLP